MRKGLFVLMLAAVVGAAGLPFTNTEIVWEDSLRIDSTETKYTTYFELDAGVYKTLLVEGRDDTNWAADSGWSSSCTSAVDISWLQVFPVTNEYRTDRDSRIVPSGYYKYMCRLPSHAHPDSTTLHPTEFMVFDSLVIGEMETAAVYLRNSTEDTALAGGVVDYTYGDTLATLQTNGLRFGAFQYSALPADWSPAGCLKVKGTTANEKRGAGSFWRFRVYQMKNLPARGK